MEAFLQIKSAIRKTFQLLIWFSITLSAASLPEDRNEVAGDVKRGAGVREANVTEQGRGVLVRGGTVTHAASRWETESVYGGDAGALSGVNEGELE